jgi:drug/metabolite transporter (DMT)-like permease
VRFGRTPLALLRFLTRFLCTVCRAGNLIVINVANVACGLYGMRAIDVPMFLCLRRTSVAFVIAVEFVLFRRRQPMSTLASIFLICAGAVLAGWPSIDANFVGFAWVIGNNFLTALSLNMVCAGAQLWACCSASLTYCIVRRLRVSCSKRASASPMYVLLSAAACLRVVGEQPTTQCRLVCPSLRVCAELEQLRHSAVREHRLAAYVLGHRQSHRGV